MMSAKNGSDKKRRMMTLEMKHEIIEKHENVVRSVDLARQYERCTSAIPTFFKQNESIKAIKPVKRLKIISKFWTYAYEETERMLLVWLTDKELTGDSVTDGVICEARTIYCDLIKLTAGTSTMDATGELFKASLCDKVIL